MKPAQKTFAIAVAILITAALSFPKELMAAAGGPQICSPSATCVIGEFVYDDSYQPVLDATCTITSRYPDNSSYLSLQAMTVSDEDDGWYSYSFTAPATTGLYRTQVCCDVGGDDMCLDKSFEVKEESTVSSSAIATAVWEYSGRTLSSFGSLVTDVWGTSTRTLSSFGDLVSNVWNNTTRTLSGTSDVAEVKESIDETRLLIEQIINKPIIENVLEEESDLDLSGRLKETRAIANQVYVNGQYLTTEVGGLLAGFQTATSQDIISKLTEVEEILGQKEDTDTKNSIYGAVNWFNGFWGWQETLTMKATLTDISGAILNIRTSLLQSGKTLSVKSDLTKLVRVLLSFEKEVGKLSDSQKEKTLYGDIKRVETLAQSFDSQESEINGVLAEWKNKDINLTNVQSKLKNILSQVLTLSQIPKSKNVLGLSDSKMVSDAKALKNTLLRLQGLIKTNRVLLARGIGKTLANTWIEEGSIVFKTLATNPSNLVSQDVAIKYYLPQEIREEDIISKDEGLEVKYDSEKDQYYVAGSYTLTPGTTKVISVKTQDIWVISESEVESFKAQASQLNKPLEKTAFFAQGVTLKSDIDASLDKILSLQESAITPEQKIRAFREASIEKKSVLAKMDSLKSLVTQASSVGGIFGFVGGAQAVGVWGIIIVIAAGFVFLAIYMKNLNTNGRVNKNTKEKNAPEKSGGFGFPFKFALPVILISSIITAFVVSFAFQQQMKVLGAKVEASQCQTNVTVEEKMN